MSQPLVLVSALGSTTFAALATALKHRTATQLPPRTGARLGYWLRAASRPLWLLALTADVAALSLQILALHIGALAVVQPLLITALLFSLLLHHRFERTWPSRREVAYALLLVLFLVGFLVASGAASPTATVHAQPADKAVAVFAAVAGIAVTCACVVAPRVTPRLNRAALLGVSVAFCYAASAALIKACTNVFAVDPARLVTSWQPYALVVTGVLGLLLAQLAFRAGPLTASLPAIAALDPVLSVALGVLVYDEPLRRGLVAEVLELVTLAGLGLSAFALTGLERSWMATGTGPDACPRGVGSPAEPAVAPDAAPRRR